MDGSHVFDFNLEGQMGEGERGREGGRERERDLVAVTIATENLTPSSVRTESDL